MTAAIVTAWLHYVAVILMAGGAFAEMYLLKLLPSFESVKATARADRLYGIGAGLVLLTGFARMPLPHGGKGMAYYMHVPAFHIAITLFVIAAVISLGPTFKLIKWNKAAAGGTLPSPAEWGGIRKFMHIQLLLIVLIALAMPWMAGRGG